MDFDDIGCVVAMTRNEYIDEMIKRLEHEATYVTHGDVHQELAEYLKSLKGIGPDPYAGKREVMVLPTKTTGRIK